MDFETHCAPSAKFWHFSHAPRAWFSLSCYNSTMIPSDKLVEELWDRYSLPEQKRIHVTLVARVAVFLGNALNERAGQKGLPTDLKINLKLLEAAALLHDIDKAVPKLAGDRHPDAGVRVLKEEGLVEVADLVATHPLHAILDLKISPKTWEQKLLYLADKMVKYDIVGVDRRFALWNNEHLPPEAQKILDESYPLVKKLEQEVFTLAGISLDDVVKLA